MWVPQRYVLPTVQLLSRMFHWTQAVWQKVGFVRYAVQVNAQCYDYDMYNMLYICLFPYRFKNWGFKSFIRETKGPSSTSASW